MEPKLGKQTAGLPRGFVLGWVFGPIFGTVPLRDSEGCTQRLSKRSRGEGEAQGAVAVGAAAGRKPAGQGRARVPQAPQAEARGWLAKNCVRMVRPNARGAWQAARIAGGFRRPRHGLLRDLPAPAQNFRSRLWHARR